MPVPSHICLRRLSVVLPTVALAMVVGGLTFLAPRLRGTAFVLYWLGCFAAAGLSIIVAGFDVLAIRRAARQAQRELIENSFHGVSVKPPHPSRKTDKSGA